MSNFIWREQVIEILKRHGAKEIQIEVERLWSFPPPNPGMLNDRNVMGQTEQEFWDAVDRDNLYPPDFGSRHSRAAEEYQALARVKSDMRKKS